MVDEVQADGFLAGVRVVELAGELGEFCGRTLAGLGAEVIKVEPPEGEDTRNIGPFVDDEPGPDRSLHFIHYNFGKKSVRLDLDDAAGREKFLELIATADVLLEARPVGYLAERGIDPEMLSAKNPSLIHTRITPFGETGPWRDFHGTDLVHLALGGVVMNCGYDPEPTGEYDLPPMAPQGGQAWNITGEMALMAVLSALNHQARTGEGDFITLSAHQAIAQSTETDVPNWLYAKLKHYRATARHSRPYPEPRTIEMTKDGRWLLPYRSYLGGGVREFRQVLNILDRHGMADDLNDEKYLDDSYRRRPEVNQHINDVVGRLVGRFVFSKDIWREFQEAGSTWAPVRRPEENLTDAHWRQRQTFLQVKHSEFKRTFSEIGARWMCPEVPWRTGPRAPMLGEHDDLLSDLTGVEESADRPVASRWQVSARAEEGGDELPLQGTRIVDLGWLLASGGAGRFLAAEGAEVIRVEHHTRFDRIRWGNAIPPQGGRAARDLLPDDLPRPVAAPLPDADPNRSGFFMDINAGKRSVGLNLKSPAGREILEQLVSSSSALLEGFSPGTMENLGLGYERLKQLNPAIVYAQQSGMGQIGVYGRMRSYGPVAQAISGITDMSGLPMPAPPAGIGYSYLDWFGAYNLANAVFAALYRQRRTGKGCWVDSSQVEAGTYLTGTAVLDYSVNGRSWTRSGNRARGIDAAPHGIYPVAGSDRWIAISVLTDEQYVRFAKLLDLDRPGFGELATRLVHQDELDELVAAATRPWEGEALMQALQNAGIPAGVCQTAQDRIENDHQLADLEWLVDLPQKDMGVWPVKDIPWRHHRVDAHIGGPLHRHGPSYGEDNHYVFGEVLGLSDREIRRLEVDGVISGPDQHSA